MNTFSTDVVLYFTFLILGNVLLLALLLTLAFAKWLPQRKNIFLVNLVLTTYLSTFPPMLLLITGNLVQNPPKSICFVQAVLMDGDAQMFGSAFLILVISVWCNIRASMQGLSCPLQSRPGMKAILFITPYLLFIIFSLTSLGLALMQPLNPTLGELAMCDNNAFYSDKIRRSTGFILAAFCLIEIFFEATLTIMIFKISPRLTTAQKRLNRYTYVWADNNLLLRIFMFTFLMTATLLVGAMESSQLIPNSVNTFQVLQSLNPLLTFIVFGTSQNVLNVWRGRGRP